MSSKNFLFIFQRRTTSKPFPKIPSKRFLDFNSQNFDLGQIPQPSSQFMQSFLFFDDIEKAGTLKK